ncbi:unnamed protein product [Linum tenue]|uniref:Uncharacterized protein n=1 Tax=Linum tenue TaxID=586396 RepID=A0AAV0LWQ1_9ROSI|nr:unnamed protein product [Linum tenue]
MVVSDFYAFHSHFKTRLLLHFKDSSRGSFHILSSVTDLLKNSSKLKAIILIARTELESEILAEFGKKSGIPIISFPSPGFQSRATKTEELQSPIGSSWAYNLLFDLACAVEKLTTRTAAKPDHYYSNSELLDEVSAGAKFVNRESVPSASLEVVNAMIMNRGGGKRKKKKIWVPFRRSREIRRTDRGIFKTREKDGPSTE